jgi:hypothetical protein
MGIKRSWKEKVDPALADQIKVFVESLKLIEEPDSEEFIEEIKNSSIKSFKPFYKENEQFRQIIDLAKFMHNQNVADIKTNIKKQEMLETEFEKRVTPEMLVFLSFHFLNFISILLEKKSLIAFYQEAQAGNEESLLKLLRYDKTLFDHEWFREIIFKEALVGNSNFFKKLGDAIKSEPLIDKHRQGKLKLILVLFWNAAFSKLTDTQQMEMLDYIGLESPFSPDTYKKFRKREITPLFKKK